jgi:MIP family channel proteins
VLHIDSRRLLAECIGTCMLVFIGPGTAAVAAWSRQDPGVGVALAFGFVILAGVYALGHISGAHFNPAVTAGFWIARRFPSREVLPYVASQLIGATVAALALRAILGDAARASATMLAVPAGAGLAVEVALTFFLMLVVMAVATDARVAGPVAGIAVGLTVGFDALMGGPLTGASMNPARSFGPAIANGLWAGHWVYWLGPLAGAALAVFTYGYLRHGSAHDYRAGGEVRIGG